MDNKVVFYVDTKKEKKAFGIRSKFLHTVSKL